MKGRTRNYSQEQYAEKRRKKVEKLGLKVYKLWKDGIDISSGILQKTREQGKLVEVARRAGIAWSEVVVAAGISLEEFEERKLLYRELRALVKERPLISAHTIRETNKYKALCPVIEKHIGWKQLPTVLVSLRK